MLKIRDDRWLNQRAAADYLGVCPHTPGRWDRGKGTPPGWPGVSRGLGRDLPRYRLPDLEDLMLKRRKGQRNDTLRAV